MIGAPRSPGVGKNKNAFLVVHERLRFSEVGGTRPVFHREAIRSVPSPPAHDAARAARHLRDDVGSKALDDLVERALDRRESGQMLDQTVPSANGVPALHGLAVAGDRTGGEVSGIVGERLEQLRGKGMLEVVQDIFPRGYIDLDVVPFLSGYLRKASLH